MKKRILVILCVLTAHLAISQSGSVSYMHNPVSLNQSEGGAACDVEMDQYLIVSISDNNKGTAIVFNILMERLCTPDEGLNQPLP